MINPISRLFTTLRSNSNWPLNSFTWLVKIFWCYMTGTYMYIWIIECSEKYKSFKLKIPQPDSEQRYSPDFRTLFGIMIGPFSFCKIGKTWGTNKQVNKQTNKQKLKFSISTTRLPTTSQSWFQNSFWNHDWTIFLLRNWQNVRYKQTSKQTNKRTTSQS